VAQVRICGGIPTGVLSGHALRLPNERFQLVDAQGHYTQTSACEDNECMWMLCQQSYSATPCKENRLRRIWMI
jgi:hypothetical protein